MVSILGNCNNNKKLVSNVGTFYYILHEPHTDKERLVWSHTKTNRGNMKNEKLVEEVQQI